MFSNKRALAVLIGGMASGVCGMVLAQATSNPGQPVSGAAPPVATAQPAKAAAPVAAPPASAQVPVGNAELAREIATLSEMAAKLEAESKVLKQRVEVAKQQAELDRLHGRSAPESSGTPSVRAIEGSAGKYTATLVLPNGAVQNVRSGEKVHGWSVGSIHLNEVWLTKGKQRERLTLGNAPAPVQPAPVGQPAGERPL